MQIYLTKNISFQRVKHFVIISLSNVTKQELEELRKILSISVLQFEPNMKWQQRSGSVINAFLANHFKTFFSFISIQKEGFGRKHTYSVKKYFLNRWSHAKNKYIGDESMIKLGIAHIFWNNWQKVYFYIGWFSFVKVGIS